jgi:hypothetical protein
MLCGHVLAVRLREHAFLQNTNSQTLPRLCAIILRNQNPSPPKSCAINAKKCNPLHHHLTTKHITKPHICRLELYSIQKLGVSMRFPSSPIVVHFQSLVSPKKKNPLLSLSVIVSSGVFIHANLLSPACQIAGPPQTLLVCVVLDLLPLLPQVRQLMMMAKSETMALMMALIPAAMALTMAMMQFPMVRKTPWICLCC